MKTKQFQEDTADRIIDVFKTQSVFALADEVGLGKTLVCAEVAARRIEAADRRGDKGPLIIYYVAPSLELIEQNLDSIRAYLKKRFDGERHIIPHTSRMTKVAADIDLKEKEVKKLKKCNVHLVGLSPITSFRLNRVGLLAEREYLAALFGLGCRASQRKHVNEIFWCLKDSHLGSEFSEKIRSRREGVGIAKEFKRISKNKQFHDNLSKIISTHPTKKRNDERKLVAGVRRFIASEWIMESKTEFVILDEWHKYKDICFGDDLLPAFLDKLRKSKNSKLLLVSATPFSISFKDEENSINTAGDLQGLMQLYFGKNSYLEHYTNLQKKQKAFLESAHQYLSNSTLKTEKALRDSRNRYQKALSNYCVRTERPHAISEREDLKTASFTWDEQKINSLKVFLDKFSNVDSTRTPILSMWQDGHTFPSFNDYKISSRKISNITETHWKIGELEKLLTVNFEKADRLHNFNRSPLWLFPKSPLRKYLIFSDFQFVPNEICNQVAFGVPKNKRYSIDRIRLGYLPMTHLKRKKERSVLVKEFQKNIHWLLFYPLIGKKNPMNEGSDNQTTNIIDRIKRFEKSNPSKDLLTVGRIAARERLWDCKYRATVRGLSDQYFQFLSNPSSQIMTVGELINMAIEESGIYDSLRNEFSLTEANSRNDLIEEFEKALANLSENIMHLFSSDEALILGQSARTNRLIPAHLQKLNEHVAFAIWYSNTYNLKGTLAEFGKILLSNGFSCIQAVNEIALTVGLRKSSRGSRFVRPFNDKKASDQSDRQHSLDRKSVRRAFNSPFAPFVLVSTSVGQEGLDFHRYCDTVIHWSPPSSPNSRKQREGRVDRYRSMQNRSALEDLGKDYEDCPISNNELSPDFVVMNEKNQRMNRTKAIVFALPFTSQERKWKRCLERSYYNDILIGSPDPLAAEQRLIGLLDKMSKKTKIEKLETIKKFCVNLSPKPKKSK